MFIVFSILPNLHNQVQEQGTYRIFQTCPLRYLARSLSICTNQGIKAFCITSFGMWLSTLLIYTSTSLPLQYQFSSFSIHWRYRYQGAPTYYRSLNKSSEPNLLIAIQQPKILFYFLRNQIVHFWETSFSRCSPSIISRLDHEFIISRTLCLDTSLQQRFPFLKSSEIQKRISINMSTKKALLREVRLQLDFSAIQQTWMRWLIVRIILFV